MSKDAGWVKLHRKLLENPIVMKDSDHLAVWIWLLLNATHEPIDRNFGGERVTLKPGELITGRLKLGRILSINPSKIYRILKSFKIEQQIEQRTDRQSSLISVKNWSSYQKSEQRNGQRVNNDRTHHNKGYKEYKKESLNFKEENPDGLGFFLT